MTVSVKQKAQQTANWVQRALTYEVSSITSIQAAWTTYSTLCTCIRKNSIVTGWHLHVNCCHYSLFGWINLVNDPRVCLKAVLPWKINMQKTRDGVHCHSLAHRELSSSSSYEGHKGHRYLLQISPSRKINKHKQRSYTESNVTLVTLAHGSSYSFHCRAPSVTS